MVFMLKTYNENKFANNRKLGENEQARFTIKSPRRDIDPSFSTEQGETHLEMDHNRAAVRRRTLGFVFTPADLDAASAHSDRARLVLCFLLDGHFFCGWLSPSPLAYALLPKEMLPKGSTNYWKEHDQHFCVKPGQLSSK